MAIDLPPVSPQEITPFQVSVTRAVSEPISTDSNGFFYTVTGNERLDRERVIAALQSGDTPQAALEALRRAYFDAGFFLTALGAEVSNKLVAIKVVNGRITELETTPALAPFFTGLEEREDLDRNTMIRRTTIAENYLSRQGMRPTINFAPAAALGGSKLTVTEEPIEGASPWNMAMAFNNLGSRFSSRYVAQASGAFRPGGGLELTANYLQGIPGLSSDSSGASYHAGGFGVSLVTPWGVFGGSYNNIRYRIGESSAPLYPDGDISIGVINSTQLLFADETTRWSVTTAYTQVSNLVNVFDGFFDLTDQNYGFVSLGTSYNKGFSAFGLNAGMAAGFTVSQGISARSGTFNPVLDGVPNPRFNLLQGNISYSQYLPWGMTSSISATGQYANATVPQNQQWVLGGLGNLSAWFPAVLVGDSGALARMTLAAPPVQWQGATITGNVFAEAGMVSSYFNLPTAPSDKGLGDAGLTLSGSLSGGTSMLVAYAWPVWHRNLSQAERDALPRANLYFSLNQSF